MHPLHTNLDGLDLGLVCVNVLYQTQTSMPHNVEPGSNLGILVLGCISLANDLNEVGLGREPLLLQAVGFVHHALNVSRQRFDGSLERPHRFAILHPIQHLFVFAIELIDAAHLLLDFFIATTDLRLALANLIISRPQSLGLPLQLVSESRPFGLGIFRTHLEPRQPILHVGRLDLLVMDLAHHCSLFLHQCHRCLGHGRLLMLVGANLQFQVLAISGDELNFVVDRLHLILQLANGTLDRILLLVGCRKGLFQYLVLFLGRFVVGLGLFNLLLEISSLALQLVVCQRQILLVSLSLRQLGSEALHRTGIVLGTRL
mmetsp:Transcript_27375/g.78903  ORF Transcript_27375/g.78903 Transcript_27375/m.78903 type:complete len:316 (+) Transcript_27375:673-1620(+)